MSTTNQIHNQSQSHILNYKRKNSFFECYYTQELLRYLRREGLNAYHGGAYRFKERPQDSRRRLAYFEAKRIVANELERKKAYLSENFIETGNR